MKLADKLVRIYFDIAYNQVYDLTTARFNLYQELQKRCVGKLKIEDDDKVLCVGLGTGNEIQHILESNKDVSITGVDYSTTALRKAREKAAGLNNRIRLFLMDARNLDFPTGNFDKVLCLHVMDFINDHQLVGKEILRVLNTGGQFVITYPSDSEGLKLGLSLLKSTLRLKSSYSGIFIRIRALGQVLIHVLVGTVYLPLLFRPKSKPYSLTELERMLTEIMTDNFEIEEEARYHDYIVHGTK